MLAELGADLPVPIEAPAENVEVFLLSDQSKSVAGSDRKLDARFRREGCDEGEGQREFDVF